MMKDSGSNPYPSTLLDLMLGQLQGKERDDFEFQVASDPHLQAQKHELTETFEALSAWQVTAPAGLSSRLLERLHARMPQTPQLAPRSSKRPRFNNEPVVLRMGNLRDIIAVAAMVVLAFGLGVPGALNMKARNQRVMCSQNLAMLGQGVQQYSSTYASALPFVGWRDGATWRPDATRAGAGVVPNRQHMYPLLQAQFVADPRLFICPSQTDIPMSNDDVSRYGSFPEARNVSYAYYNMSGVRPSADAPASLPILSDDNPLFANGIPLQDLRIWLQGDVSRVNSHAHRGVGQNVLSLDGHVQFARTPTVGLDGDNIWTLKDVSTYTGHEGPRSATDSHLLK